MKICIIVSCCKTSLLGAVLIKFTKQPLRVCSYVSYSEIYLMIMKICLKKQAFLCGTSSASSKVEIIIR